MKASILDLRRRMKDILRALDQNESVIILYRGKKKGVILPIGMEKNKQKPISAHPAFGLWKDRKDMEDVEAAVDELRKARNHAI